MYQRMICMQPGMDVQFSYSVAWEESPITASARLQMWALGDVKEPFCCICTSVKVYIFCFQAREIKKECNVKE